MVLCQDCWRYGKKRKGECAYWGKKKSPHESCFMGEREEPTAVKEEDLENLLQTRTDMKLMIRELVQYLKKEQMDQQKKAKKVKPGDSPNVEFLMGFHKGQAAAAELTLNKITSHPAYFMTDLKGFVENDEK